MSVNLKAIFDKAKAADDEVKRIATQVADLFDKGQTDEALKLKPAMDKAQEDAKQLNELYLSMKMATSGGEDGNPAQNFVPAGGDKEPAEVTDMRGSKEYAAAFWDAFKHGVTPKNIGERGAERYGLLMNAISETGGSPVGSEGGFLNPVDFDNKIHELMRAYIDLGNFVTTEPVVAYSGWRAVEKQAAALPLTAMVELAVLEDDDEGESPQFSKVAYTTVDYGDFIRVSNDQLADTPVNLMNYLSRWFAKKVILTHNALILAKINAITGTAVTDYKKTLAGIKTALNTTLDPIFSASAILIVNQSGLDLLDQLDDGTGRSLLQPDPSNATAFRVKGRPVVVLSTAHWANLSGPAKTRIAIGDGKEYATLFERQAFEFASTNTGGSAWRSNSTEVRGIARMDVQEVDSGAMEVLKVTLPA